MSAKKAKRADGEKQPTWLNKKGGLYMNSVSEIYYERPKISGIYTFRTLGTTNQKLARIELTTRQETRARGEDPQPKQRAGVTVGEVITKYREGGYLDKNRRERPENMKKAEATNCINLYKYWEKVPVDDITVAENDRYHTWRVALIRKQAMVKSEEVAKNRAEAKEEALAKANKKNDPTARKKTLDKIEEKYAEDDSAGLKIDKGHRTVDLDLNTLRNALLWAARTELIKHLPPTTVWKRYSISGEVEHCREFMVHSSDELHKVAGMMFESKGHNGGRSQVIGWQILFEGCTGLRTIEVLGLRLDAKPHEPGWISEDGKYLCVRRAKDPENKSKNPFVEINEGLAAILPEFRKWHAKKHPESPWYFPSPRKKGQSINESGIIHGMLRISEKIDRKLTSHGLRAFYVTVRRSHGISDPQIGWEIGHEPGQTLAEVYGGIPPNWLSGGGTKMSFLPKGEPAWTVLEEKPL